MEVAGAAAVRGGGLCGPCGSEQSWFEGGVEGERVDGGDAVWLQWCSARFGVSVLRRQRPGGFGGRGTSASASLHQGRTGSMEARTVGAM